MKDCDCQKNISLKYWPSKGDTGDEFLKKDNFNLIYDIYENIKKIETNTSSMFNLFYEEELLNNLDLDETTFDNFLVSRKEEDGLIDENPDMNQSMTKPSEEDILIDENTDMNQSMTKPSEEDVLIDENPDMTQSMTKPSEEDILIDENPDMTQSMTKPSEEDDMTQSMMKPSEEDVLIDENPDMTQSMMNPSEEENLQLADKIYNDEKDNSESPEPEEDVFTLMDELK